MFGILGGERGGTGCRRRVHREIKRWHYARFSLWDDLKVPNSGGGDRFFAMIVIVGNKLLMSNLFRISFLVGR